MVFSIFSGCNACIRGFISGVSAQNTIFAGLSLTNFA